MIKFIDKFKIKGRGMTYLVSKEANPGIDFSVGSAVFVEGRNLSILAIEMSSRCEDQIAIVVSEKEVEVPARYKYRLYRHDDNCGAYVIQDHYGDTFDNFVRLVQRARTDFPDLKDGDISLGKVRGSGYMDGQVVITFPVDKGWKVPVHYMQYGSSRPDFKFHM